MFHVEVMERQWLTMHACHPHIRRPHVRTDGWTDGRYSRPHSRGVRDGIKDEHVRRKVDTVEGKAQQAGSHTRRTLLTYFKLSILFNALRSSPHSFLSRGLFAYIARVVLDLKIIIQSDAMSLAA